MQYKHRDSRHYKSPIWKPKRSGRVNGYLETIPELVVEIRSKNDTLDELRRKSQEYLQAGVNVVWVIDPAAKTVTIFRTAEAAIELRGKDALTAAGVVEGFKVPVSELFGE